MRRVIGSIDTEEDTLKEWVDNAVRGFQLGNRRDLADAAEAHLNVILTRRKAAGEWDQSLHTCLHRFNYLVSPHQSCNLSP